MEGAQRSFTNLVILLASFGMLALTVWLYEKGEIGFEGILICTIAMMGSFGPVVALSSLSNNLNQTLASGERVLSLLEETPMVEEIPEDMHIKTVSENFSGAEAKKASIHDFIMELPIGYDTEVGELGDTLSGGEKQRIGIARAFLHDSPLILMDEPTSNLDSLNEGIILKSLREASEKKTVVLVSHRKSTMNIVDTVFEMKDGRIS